MGVVVLRVWWVQRRGCRVGKAQRAHQTKDARCPMVSVHHRL